MYNLGLRIRDETQDPYQNVAYNALAKYLNGCCHIGVDCSPVAEEGLIVDRVEFLEKDRYLYIRLDVWFRIVAELGMCKFMLDLIPSHDDTC